MKHSAKAGAAVAAPQAFSEVPLVVRRLISKKLLSPALAAAWQDQNDANVLTKLVESLDEDAHDALPANFNDAEREEIRAALIGSALKDWGASPISDPVEIKKVLLANVRDRARPKKLSSPTLGKTETPAMKPSSVAPEIETAEDAPVVDPPVTLPDPATEQTSSTVSEPVTTQRATEAGMVLALPAMSMIITGDVEAEFEAECTELARKITAYEVAFTLGWYPLADAIKELRDRYEGRLQNIAVAISNGLRRSERWVYNLLDIAKHPPELRERVRRAGLGDDQGRLLQIHKLSYEAGQRALEALATGGSKAFDAVVRGTDGLHALAEHDPVFAGVLSDFHDPAHPFGAIAATSAKATTGEFGASEG